MSIRGPEDRSWRKSFDTFSVLGPWLVTADEIPDPSTLDLAVSVNGQVRQRSNTRALIFDIPKLIAYASFAYRLYPGDIIMTGTPEGVVQALHASIVAASKDTALRAAFEQAGLETATLTPAEYGKQLQRDREYWAPVVRASGFRSED